MSEMKIGCGSAVSSEEVSLLEKKDEVKNIDKKKELSMIKVGKPAPDFKLPAYHKGQFTEVKLSDFKGKWVVVCFYPGDFTFV